MKKQIFNLSKGVLSVLLWTLSLCLYAQGITVRGVVTDTQGEPLVGVTVQVEGTSTGTVTDMDGNFVLQNVPSNATLEVSYVGMTTQVVSLNPHCSTIINRS